MMQDTDLPLFHLEGLHVGLSLADGSRIDDCQLVSAGRTAVDCAWVFVNGTDRFVPRHNIIDAWEVRAA